MLGGKKKKGGRFRLPGLKAFTIKKKGTGKHERGGLNEGKDLGIILKWGEKNNHGYGPGSNQTKDCYCWGKGGRPCNRGGKKLVIRCGF